MTTKERLIEARWVFERQIAWIAAAEVKVGVVSAMQVAMLGGLGAAYSAATTRSAWIIGSSFACAVFSVVAIFCAAMAVRPRTDGPQTSLLFFGRVASLTAPDYTDRFAKVTDEELLQDLTSQIHRNAQIACAKHDWVGKAVVMSFMSAIPWLAAIAMLVKI